jgi:ribosomal protein L25 (general stress protein Ctc)
MKRRISEQAAPDIYDEGRYPAKCYEAREAHQHTCSRRNQVQLTVHEHARFIYTSILELDRYGMSKTKSGSTNSSRTCAIHMYRHTDSHVAKTVMNQKVHGISSDERQRLI